MVACASAPSPEPANEVPALIVAAAAAAIHQLARQIPEGRVAIDTSDGGIRPWVTEAAASARLDRLDLQTTRTCDRVTLRCWFAGGSPPAAILQLQSTAAELITALHEGSATITLTVWWESGSAGTRRTAGRQLEIRMWRAAPEGWRAIGVRTVFEMH
jgi:hypothetical protein